MTRPALLALSLLLAACGGSKQGMAPCDDGLGGNGGQVGTAGAGGEGGDDAEGGAAPVAPQETCQGWCLARSECDGAAYQPCLDLCMGSVDMCAPVELALLSVCTAYLCTEGLGGTDLGKSCAQAIPCITDPL